MRLILFLISLLLFSANAQEVKDFSVKTKSNEVERKQLLDIARSEVEKDIKQKVLFKVRHLKVSQNYAWLEADAIAASGGELRMPDDYYDCCHVEGLFEKRNGKWQKVEFAGFSTDCWYCGISQNHPKAPKEIFSKAAAMETGSKE